MHEAKSYDGGMTKTARRLTALALALTLAASHAGAQLATPAGATSNTVTYDMLKLQVQPQVIDIYPNMKTAVFFDDQLLEINTGNPDLFNIDINANRTGFYISSTGPTGMTDLYVTTASNITAMFIIKVHPVGLSPQRIEVTMPRNAYDGTAGAGVGSSAVSAATPSQSGAARPVLPGSSAGTLATPTPAIAPAPQPPVQSQADPAPTPAAQIGLVFKTSREGNNLRIDYTLTPEAQGTFTPATTVDGKTNPADLSVRAKGQEIGYRLLRRNGAGQHSATRSDPEQGTILIANPDTVGAITITWTLRSSSGDKVYTEIINN